MKFFMLHLNVQKEKEYQIDTPASPKHITAKKITQKLC